MKVGKESLSSRWLETLNVKACGCILPFILGYSPRETFGENLMENENLDRAEPTTTDSPGTGGKQSRYCERLKNAPWYKWPSVTLRAMYDWVLSWASSPYGWLALFIIAFAESSFFPIPPDVLLIALVLGWRRKAFHLAALCTLGSVLGAMFGYWIGSSFFGPVNSLLALIIGADSWYGVASQAAQVVTLDGFDFYRYPDGGQGQSVFLSVKDLYDKNAFMAVFSAAFTPIPFKVFTIAGGYFKVPFVTLVVSSICGRSLRFFLVAGLLFVFGEPMKRLIEKYFDIFALVFMALLIGGFLLIGYVL